MPGKVCVALDIISVVFRLNLDKKFKKSIEIISMDRYMLHFKNNGYTPKDSRELIYRARELASDMDASVRVARIAGKFVEFDVGVEKEDNVFPMIPTGASVSDIRLS